MNGLRGAVHLVCHLKIVNIYRKSSGYKGKNSYKNIVIWYQNRKNVARTEDQFEIQKKDIWGLYSRYLSHIFKGKKGGF